MKTLLVAIDAKYIHKSVAVWYLKSYCENLGLNGIDIFECTVNNNKEALLKKILETGAPVVGFSCYIWNISLVKWLCKNIKAAKSSISIILGGPEMDDALTNNDLPECDTVIIGQGEKAFYNVMKVLISGKKTEKFVMGESLGLSELPSPYTAEYFNSIKTSEKDLKIKLIYYESSRGCPFSCAYCLSGKSNKVDYLSMERVESDILNFVNHGFCTIKFIDRTFNANKARAYEILQFISNLDTKATFHFEVAADLFDEKTLSLINKMPLKRVQFEIGIQSTNAKVLAAVNRVSNVKNALNNSAKILATQNCSVHLDLIAGLPHEDINAFITSFNDCIRVRPTKLQLGFLKLLRGSKIRDESKNYGYIFSSEPPYEVISNQHVSEADLSRLRAAEGTLNKFYNKPMFSSSLRYLLDNQYKENNFAFFEDFSAYLKIEHISQLPLKDCYTQLYNFMSNLVGENIAAHFIKLDALAFHPKNLLPDNLPLQKKHKRQQEYLRQNPHHKRIRIEHFPYISKDIIFFYDKPKSLNGLYPYKILN